MSPIAVGLRCIELLAILTGGAVYPSLEEAVLPQVPTFSQLTLLAIDLDMSLIPYDP